MYTCGTSVRSSVPNGASKEISGVVSHSHHPEKFFENFEKSTCFFWDGMLLYRSAQVSGTKYPGVAKFGIALEWGSRGLEFESRHSDQISTMVLIRNHRAFSILIDFYTAI